MPGYTVAVSNGGGGPATSITGLVDAGDNVTITGTGTHADPYIIAASGDVVVENAHVAPGEDVKITGVGTERDPYVISSVTTDQVKAGTDIRMTGTGTTKDPYVIAAQETRVGDLIEAGDNISVKGQGIYGDPVTITADATGLVTAGDNVTLTGTGTAKDPYVITAVGGGTSTPTHLVAGQNITVTGTGTLADPFVVSAQLPARGEPIELTLLPPATGLANPCTVTRNPDGSAALGGAFHVKGPWPEGKTLKFSNLPSGYAPKTGGTYSTAAYIIQPFGLFTALININGEPDREMSVDLPQVPDGSSITVYLDGVVFWPMEEGS